MSRSVTPHVQPPMRHGVTASKVFLPQLNPIPHTIYDFLIHEFPHISAEVWKTRFEDGLILNHDAQVIDLNHPYVANQHIYYYRFLDHEISVPFQHQILFEDEHLVVVDKPHFLTISPSGKYVQETLLVRLKKDKGIAELTPIHRLDRETAGVVLFSKNVASRGAYQQLFAEKQIQKTYHAIAAYSATIAFPQQVKLRMEKGEPFYTMQVVDGLANSETHIELIDHNTQWAKYLLKPITGKQHQLRVHLNSLGLPIRHDSFYPNVHHKADDDFSQPLQLLAKSIAFIDPLSKEKRYFESKFELNLED